MKRPVTIITLSLGVSIFCAGTGMCAEFAAGAARDDGTAIAAGAQRTVKAVGTPDTVDDGAEWTDPDSERNADLERAQDGAIEQESRLKDYVSIRKRRRIFRFNMGFSLGAMGYGAFGPRRAVTERYRFRYEKSSFNLGFRGGMEAYLFIKRRHCLSAGFFYEQRKIQIKIVDLAIMGPILNQIPFLFLYYLPLEQRIDKSNVDTNYFAFPIAYRFYVLDEFYAGISLDLAVPFQARATYGITFYSRKMDFKRFLHPVDFGGRLLFGFTMNRVFLEVGIGCGFIDYDRLTGERHPISLTGMMGYKI
ncbi:MAG: outer membrane beta-barrel protein [Spirochaetes bacterium]|nr:outer membrane beta-barrel protein [Spirochaetota bacterium]